MAYGDVGAAMNALPRANETLDGAWSRMDLLYESDTEDLSIDPTMLKKGDSEFWPHSVGGWDNWCRPVRSALGSISVLFVFCPRGPTDPSIEGWKKKIGEKASKQASKRCHVCQRERGNKKDQHG